MAKDPHDTLTDDWVDDAEERRFREEQEHARRAMRKKRNGEKHAGLQERDGRDPSYIQRGNKHQRQKG
jgi:hypothetical protein